VRRALSKAALAVAATVVALLIAEGLARVFGAPWQYGQVLPLGDVETRSVGDVVLWSDKYPRSDAADVQGARQDRDGFTILGLGDSIMYGVMQDKQDTYLEAARRRLAAQSPRPVHVLNLAVPGYNTLQENAVYAEIAPQIAADLVLVHYWQNDAHQYRVVGGYVVDFADLSPDGRLVVRALPLPDALSDWLLIHSTLYGMLTDVAVEYRRRNQPDDWSAVERPLAEINRRARAGGGRAVVLSSPLMTGATPQSNSDIDKLRQLAAREGIEVIDLTDWVAGHPSQELSFDGSHFTAAGHRLIGERLADYVLQHDLKRPAEERTTQ
jgi:lysophospholipase L1-like esterase